MYQNNDLLIVLHGSLGFRVTKSKGKAENKFASYVAIYLEGVVFGDNHTRWFTL